MRSFIKITKPIMFALFLMGCSHNVEPKKTLQEKSSVTQTPAVMLWHDGSKGGLYGIGEGWIIEIQDPEFETLREVISIGPATTEFIVVNAEREWVKHDGEDLGSGPIMEKRLVMLPAEYETVTETIVGVPPSSEYHMADAIYGPAGHVETPRAVKLRIIPAVTKQVERRVVTVPKRTEERLVTVERRKGYRRVLIRPARVQERILPTPPKVVIRDIVKVPYQFIIKNPDGDIAHVFYEFENLKAFVDSLNQHTSGLSGKTFKIVKVNDYVLPKAPPQIKARFANGEIHLVGTCNPTWGHYELTGDSFTLNAMGNLRQNACTELVEMPDGRITERMAQTPNVITEDEFIKIGEGSFKIQWYPNEAHFIDSNGNTLLILEH